MSVHASPLRAPLSARELVAARYGDRRPTRARPNRPAIAQIGRASAGAETALSASLAAAVRPAPLATRLLRNMSFGPTPYSVAEFNGLGDSNAERLANWVDWQLDWTNIDDSALDQRLAAAGYTTLGKTLHQLWADHVLPNPEYSVRMRPAIETQRAAWVRATYSRRQLREKTVAFWHNHFNVFATDFSAGPVFVHYDRDVIRKHAFGNFRAMLEAVATSPSMLYYLDNYANTRAGPNENWARELLELHTLGAENYYGFADPTTLPGDPVDPSYPIGYTDIDVYEVASAFTGWTLRDGNWMYPTEDDGSFVYREPWHDAGPKLILGKLLFPEQPDMKDGRDVLDRLASHPAVARHICTKLVRYFVSDTPPPALVESAAAIFRAQWRATDQIAQVLRHILNSADLVNAWGQKVQRPFETIVAAMRACGSNWTILPSGARSDEFAWRFAPTGHEPFGWPAPNGYPDTASAWLGSSSFAMTWRMLNWLVGTADGATPLLPIVEISRDKVPAWTATALVDYWCKRLLGSLPDAARRTALIAFMAQNGDPSTYVIADNDAWSGSDLKKHYNLQRLQSMVSLILMSPEFASR